MNLQILKNISLADKSSWQVGGPAEFYCQPQSVSELRECLRWAKTNNHSITVLGGGSNVLISDLGIKGLVIGLQKLNEVKTEVKDNRLWIYAQAGVGKSEILKIYLKHKLAPALFLAGLPGDVGGGVVMNAGVGEMIQPREFCEIVEEVEVLKIDEPELPIKIYKQKDLKWSYRHTNGWQPGIVTQVTMVWPIEPQENILDQVRSANKNRFSKQPLELPSCGSVFVNPKDHKAAQLIQECGLKGFTIGGAQVSLKHANFIVNLNNQAKASEIHQVIQHVQNVVLEKTSVQLKTEVVYLGEW